MYRNYADSGGTRMNTASEEIRLLNAISRVSARLARNLTILATCQSEKGDENYVKNGKDHQRTSECRRCY